MKYLVAEHFPHYEHSKGIDGKITSRLIDPVVLATKDEAILVAISWHGEKPVAIIQEADPEDDASYHHEFVGAVIDDAYKPASILKRDALKAIEPLAKFSDLIFGDGSSESQDFQETWQILKFVLTSGIWKDSDVPSRS